MTGVMDTWPVETESVKRVRLRIQSTVLCRMCKHKEVCPQFPKRCIECDRYDKDNVIVSNET